MKAMERLAQEIKKRPAELSKIKKERSGSRNNTHQQTGIKRKQNLIDRISAVHQ